MGFSFLLSTGVPTVASVKDEPFFFMVLINAYTLLFICRYSFNERSGTYEEIRAEAMTDAAIQGESS